ncbi:MAG: hypothetical protein IJ737_06290 [Ruminococcus sp.]|nr:hypothetical protein [Ruminococcus sp.]
MTGKELLYIEDALGHEQYFKTKCRDTAQKLSDERLKALAGELEQRHSRLFGSFYGLLGQ